MNNDNRRLYKKLESIENNVQCSYIGLNKQNISSNNKRLVEAGIGKSQRGLGMNRSILKLDKLKYDIGGHQMRQA